MYKTNCNNCIVCVVLEGTKPTDGGRFARDVQKALSPNEKRL